MNDDPSLHDEQLEDEIRLVGDLVLAASQWEGPLSDQAIDEILGVNRSAGGTDVGAGGSRRVGSDEVDGDDPFGAEGVG